MKSNLYKWPFILTLWILTGASLHSQTKNNMVEMLIGKFEDYVRTIPWEEIYLHTDREEYIAGEIIWTSFYLIDRLSLRPSGNSKIVYVELLNYENRPVIQKRFLLTGGAGPGQLELPDTLSTGSYILRAYTNWMKNFLPCNCFIKNINIYNPLKSNSYLIKQGLSEYSNSQDIITSSDNSQKKGDSRILISKVNEKGDLEINIYADDNYLFRNGDQFIMFIQTHGKIDSVFSGKITGKYAKINIPVHCLNPGINQIAVFNSSGNHVCETYNYTAKNESLLLSVPPLDSYKVREKVSLDLKIEEPSATNKSTRISVSVAPGYRYHPLTDINDYLILGTEYGLNNTTGKKISELSDLQLDSLMSNISSNWINWDLIVAGQIPYLKYQNEKEEHFISGKLSDYNITDTLKPEEVLLSIPGRKPEFQYSKTDRNGNFYFRLHIDEKIKDLVILSDNASEEKKIILESSFSDKYLKRTNAEYSNIVSFPEYIEDWSINYQARKIYGIEESGEPLESKVSALRPVRFYGNPDIELKLADYVSLPEMGEIFFELLPEVSLKKRNSEYEILISERINEHTYQFFPDLFLDGVKIADASIVASLDPQDVEQIDVVKDRYVIGDHFFNGIVNIITKSADFSVIPLPDNMIRLHYRVIDPVFAFPVPDYSSEESRVISEPDFRNTLYWNPCYSPDEKGNIKIEFWTSDIKGDYEIYIQGINSEGGIISMKKPFRIE